MKAFAFGIVLAGLVLAARSATADSSLDRVRACMPQQNDAARLACYDKELGRTATAPTASTAPTSPNASASPARSVTAARGAAPATATAAATAAGPAAAITAAPAAPNTAITAASAVATDRATAGAPIATAAPATASGRATAGAAAPPTAANSPTAAGSPAAAAPIAAATSAKAADFGMTPELRHKQQVQQGINPPPPAPQSLSAKVAKVGTHGNGLLVVTLDNGQVWEQQESGDALVAVGDVVKISHGMFGALWMDDASHRRTRVKRIQ